MKTFALTLAASLLLSSAALANPTLRSDVTVTTDVVTVGDMFDDAGELSGTAIFRAPAPGTTGVVALADIESAARQIGLTDFDATGLSNVRVIRSSTLIDAAALDRLIQNKLESTGALPQGATAAITFDLADIAINAADVPKPASVLTLRYIAGAPSFAARFGIAGIDQPIDLTGTITPMIDAPRLVANTPAGTVLDQSDFTMASVPLATAQAGGYADMSQLIGKQLLRQIHSGVILRPADVGDPIVVGRNGPVTVLFHAGAMTLTVKGLAMTNASAGQPVDVLNSVTKKILHGIAQPDGTVSIDAPVTIAGL
jgi:flagellar basal body P-ring formation protein FlgA